jgi:glutamate-1-semialdehyde 2,1-aminomutase
MLYLVLNNSFICFDALNFIFGLIKECEEDRDVMSWLKDPLCHAGFKRLNQY